MIRWADEGEHSLFLFHMNEYPQLPDGIELESIAGTKKIKGIDDIDMDIRAKHIAWGIRDPYNHKEKHLILLFLLKK